MDNPSSAEALVQQAKDNAEKAKKLVKDNPQTPGTAGPVPSPQGSTIGTGAKP